MCECMFLLSWCTKTNARTTQLTLVAWVPAGTTATPEETLLSTVSMHSLSLSLSWRWAHKKRHARMHKETQFFLSRLIIVLTLTQRFTFRSSPKKINSKLKLSRSFKLNAQQFHYSTVKRSNSIINYHEIIVGNKYGNRAKNYYKLSTINQQLGNGPTVGRLHKRLLQFRLQVIVRNASLLF